MPRVAKDHVAVNVYLPPQLRQALEEEARREHRNLTNLVQWIIMQYLEGRVERSR